MTIFTVSSGYAEPPREAIDFFEKKIRPVLVQRCYECHSPEAESVKGNLLLHSRQTMRKGGDSGPAVVPGNIEESQLISAIRYESFEMPPDGKLPDNIIADFEQWIELDAPDPRDGQAAPDTQPAADIAAGRQFWSFQAPRRHPLPKVVNAFWPRQRIDWFVLRRLEQAALSPSPVADRRTLIRRLTFDLLGLPPTPAETEAFVADTSPDAWRRLVDRLLASPRLGERWARLWLDVARYAEDQAHVVGNNKSLFYPNAYLYRDWVIDAFNADLPYDEFIRQQLAADFVSPDDETGHVALGFMGLGPKYYRRGDLAVMADEWEDRVDTLTRGLLGLTVACARCHDHKYDPISTEDYYALAGVFASVEMFNRPLDEKRKTEKDGEAKSPEDALHIIRDDEVKDLHVFVRGDVNNEGPLVKRRFLEVLCSGRPIEFRQGSGRLELAEAIVRRDNPLTARVFVNRVWEQMFGQPLVGTPSNFGALGETPTHPQLLDDLAVRFMGSGWSLKWLLREIALSATYQQTGQSTAAQQAADPANRLLGRMNRRRLSVEQWRDALLAASGRLERSVGGKSIDPREFQARRRTVYSRVSRLDLNPMLALFDFPDPNAHAATRVETTTPLQKLFVLNSPFMTQHAAALAERLLAEQSKSRARIYRAYALLYSRPPTDEELQIGEAFLTAERDNPTDSWEQFAQALLASNEMLYVD